MKLKWRESRDAGCQAHTVAEIIVAVFLLGIMVVSLFAGFSSGFLIVQLARENLRATQILVQKTENIRIYKWSQVTNSAYLKPAFTNYYSPTTSSKGSTYMGFVNTAKAPSALPADYRTNVCAVTITLYWTNYPRGTTNKIVRSRQMQTYVARYGMQDYIYK